MARLRTVASGIARIFRRSKPVQMDVDTPMQMKSSSSSQSRPSAEKPAARTTTRQSDIGLDVLNNTYTPRIASHKAGFRSDGSDHQQDQEFAGGFGDDRWNDEDRITNKSGDPRIGTHKRTYEPGEAKAESRRE